MDFRLPFSRKDEKQTPDDQPKKHESQPKPPDEILTGYMELLLKSEDHVSTIDNDDLVVLRTAAAEEEIPEAVVVIDRHRGETDEIIEQHFLVASYDAERMVWSVYDKKDDTEYFEDNPGLFAERIEHYFADQLEAARQSQ